MNYINGEFSHSERNFRAINPSTELQLGQYPDSDKETVDLAISSARTAFDSWRKLSRLKRAEYFDNLCQLLKPGMPYFDRMVFAICQETGKTKNESNAEVIETLHMLQTCFGKAREPNGELVASEIEERDLSVIRKPKGVVAVIGPWNFPAAILSWTVGPALIEGNTVVMKPSEQTTGVGMVFAQVCHEAGFPPGVFNMVCGKADTGNYLINGDVNHISFTGSAKVGQIIRQVCAESRDKTCSCEMGSKSAVIVFEDAIQDLALSASIASAFKLSGQRCVSASRILIHENIYESFCSRFAELAGQIKVGPFNEDPFYGPCITKNQMEMVLKFNDLARNDPDVTVLLNGERIDRPGYFLKPFVYKCKWGDKSFLKNEVFGPHVALIPFKDTEEAIKIYNDTDFGLAVGIVTNDYRIMRECRENCDAGMIYFNLGSIGAESHLPFGGVKNSGYGWPSAAGGFDAVVHKISVTTNHGKSINFPQGLK